MAYSNLPLGAANPGCLVILLDQSGSMKDPYDTGQTKADAATQAVNRVIYEISQSCQKGKKISDRCYVAVVAYNHMTVSALLGDMISKIANNPKRVQKLKKKIPDGAGGLIEVDFDMPIWIEPKAYGGTPMTQAFEAASQTVKQWLQQYPDSFPPIVIHITDGEPNEEKKAHAAAKQLMRLKSTDGEIVLFNAHISNATAGEIKLPHNDTGFTGDSYAKFLFNISSVLPDAMVTQAKAAGFSPQAGARGFVYNAGAETLIKLLTFGSAPMR